MRASEPREAWLTKEVAPQPVGKPHGIDGHEREHEYFAGEYKSLFRIASFAKAAQDYFGNVGPALSRLFGIPGLQLDVRLTSLLAFAYTYHYLNWFIKADVIRWADIPRPRLALVIAASAASTALYFYDYAFGFTFLLALSLVHILLEFPLDSLALRQLGTAMGSGLRGSFGGAVTAAPRSRPASSKASKRTRPSRSPPQ